MSVIASVVCVLSDYCTVNADVYVNESKGALLEENVSVDNLKLELKLKLKLELQ